MNTKTKQKHKQLLYDINNNIKHTLEEDMQIDLNKNILKVIYPSGIVQEFDENGGFTESIKKIRFKKLEKLVLKWANQRGLLEEDSDIYMQAVEGASKMVKLCDAICEDDWSEQCDAIGDVMITLIILANQLDMNLRECLKCSFNSISERTGETKNGVFIKDLPDPEEIFKKVKKVK